MQIDNDKVVYFHYRLLNEAGELIEESHDREPMAYLHGHGNIMPGLEEAMAGHQAGEEVSVTLPPERAYGVRKEDSQQRVPIKHLMTKGKLKPGMNVKINTDNGARDATVIKVGRFNVDVDTNHPLAGQTLTFEVSITDVREGTTEEIAHRHVHGPGGHHH